MADRQHSITPRNNRPFVLGLGLLAALLLGNGWVSYRNTRQLDEDAAWVAHTHEVLDALEGLSSTIKDAETGQRGFLLTRDRRYLVPYEAARKAVAERLDRLQRLTVDNPEQQSRIPGLRTLVNRKMDELAQTVALMEKGDRDAALAMVQSDEGARLMDGIRSSIRAMEKEERDLLEVREGATRHAYQVAVLAGALASLSGILAVVLIALLLQRHLATRSRAEAIIAEQSERLRVTLASIGDGVLTTDTDGKVTNLNAVAESLTGWKSQEALGQPLDTVFSIINEETRKSVQDPATRALREGVVVGLANHTVLIARDGTERPIEDSAAPIKDGSGGTHGVVLVFRDATQERELARLQRNLQAELERQVQERTAELRASEERFRLLVEGTTDYAIFLLDPQGNVASWNPGAQRLKGWTAEEIVGRHFSVFYPEDTVQRGWPQEELRRATAEGRFEDEGWRLRKDGSRFWANVVITALNDDQGNLRGFSKITRDLTLRKQAEEDARRLAAEQAARQAAEENAEVIRAQREQLRITLESIGDAVAVTDAHGAITLLNPVAQALTGWKAEEAVGQPFTRVIDLHNEQTSRPAENPVERVLREGIVVGMANHTVLRSKDGTERPIEDSAAPIKDSRGQLVGCVMVFHDVSERRKAQQALRRSEEQFRQLADAMPQIVWTAGADGIIDYSNRKWHEFSGSSAEVGNEGWQDIIYPDDRAPAVERWTKCLAAGTPFEMETRLRDRHTGGYRWHLMRAVPVRDDSGAVVRWYGTATDINEQKRAGEAAWFLASASAELARVVDYESTLQKVVNLAVPYFADWAAVDVAAEGGTMRRLAVAHQLPEKVQLAQELFRRYPPDPGAPGGAAHVLRTGQPQIVEQVTDEMLVRGAKEEEHLHLIRSLGLRSFVSVPLTVSGKTLGALTFATAESGRNYNHSDLSLAEDLARRAAVAIENANLYRALHEADRRKTEFLAMLGHELRNPLAPVRNALQLMKMPAATAAVSAQAQEIIERQVQQLVRLVDDLLDVSRIMRDKIELRKERIDLAGIISRAVETAQPTIDAQGHELSVSLPPEPVRLEGDLVRLTQAVSNLLMNAAKYTERAGRIELTAGPVDGAVVIRVRDSGIGIAPELLPHIFDLFVQAEQSLARSQGGLGIGLTLVKRVVQLHGGTVTAASPGVGRGSEFVIRLPAIPVSAAPAEVSASPALAGAGGPRCRVLVVDDNVDAADSTAMLLRADGHEVRTAYNGPAALEAATEFHPDAVLLDIGLPGMSGYEVARHLRAQPSLRGVYIVAMTGYGQGEDRRRSKEAGFDHHLVKPIHPQNLQDLLVMLTKKQ